MFRPARKRSLRRPVRLLPLFAVALLASLVVVPTAVFAGGEGDPVAAVEVGESALDLPGRYVVDLQDDLEASTVTAIFAKLKLPFTTTALEPQTRIEIVTVKAGRVAAFLRAMKGDSRVEYVEPLGRVQALFEPNDPMFKDQWHMARVGAEQAWGWSAGRGVTVAVIDTGVACETFGDFTKATDLGATRCVAGYNFVQNNTHANDDHGHGTHVAGTIAQSTNNGLGTAGLAYGASIMPVKVLSAEGWGTTAGVADGIRWAADNGAQVINLSLGSPRNARVLQSAIDHARSRNVVVVAAAGNSGGSVGYPGASKGVIGVSASDTQDKLAWFSSRGKGVDIAAPGVDVTQQTICNKGRDSCERFASFSGTSMAAPHVAGVAAMVISMGVTDAAAVEEILLDSARTVDDSDNAKSHFGAGVLDAAAAAQAVARKQALIRLGLLSLLMLLAYRWSKSKGETVSPMSLTFLVPGLITGVGLLFFAPFGPLSRHTFAVDLLSRPVGDWDLLLGANIHRFLPLANALVPLGLAAIFLRVKGLAPVLSGISVGTAAYLCSVIVLGQTSTPFGWVLTTLWCGANAFLCLYLSALLLSKKRT